MNPSSRFIAEVPESHRKQGIRWLVLEEDAEKTGGSFLLLHQDLDAGSDFDSWYLTRDEAQREADTCGVTEDQWEKMFPE